MIHSRVLSSSIGGMKRDTQGFFTPCVLDNLLVNLWGRDVSECMDAILYSPISLATHQMFQQGYNPLGDWENINKVGYILYNL
jgi:hypothetical protein